MAGETFWQFESDDDGTWEHMPSEFSKPLEEQLSRGVSMFEYDFPFASGTKFYHYEVDLEKFVQTNCTTKQSRRLRRLLVTHVGSVS